MNPRAFHYAAVVALGLAGCPPSLEDKQPVAASSQAGNPVAPDQPIVTPPAATRSDSAEAKINNLLEGVPGIGPIFDHFKYLTPPDPRLPKPEQAAVWLKDGRSLTIGISQLESRRDHRNLISHVDRYIRLDDKNRQRIFELSQEATFRNGREIETNKWKITFGHFPPDAARKLEEIGAIVTQKYGLKPHMTPPDEEMHTFEPTPAKAPARARAGRKPAPAAD